MGLSYAKLWKLLIDKKMSAADLRKAINVAPNTMTKMRQDQIVSLAVLMKICDELDCDFGDIVSYVRE
ncbi:helix-turn-helix transcriptional regulator [Enterococcus faecalis]|uniref:helix-turn-helix domain-containing protein n=1 Tax=Enterococcus TaxID=1350 RepID=UPI00032EC158|nr:helix-turn-helix transcriptional regulator [Enterococcus faecalis]EGO2587016.1 helix-turn-helix transcriptional regulator [Enterococcus faecalis]EGO2833736.1 helix-turn-helix transcriptional regulator [Enterococcus faecalis]EGO5850092.1 helix-turn-helix transcriptional regulator [Enterococcus faecalis]EHS2034593.1 helix-turn-helix transcriptional regulator [Enterococcus faecalis]EIA1377396.1 helix-turn-helix transcriptional regulator [Enterococcus faecalis]